MRLIDVHVGLPIGHTRYDFDQRAVRKVIMKEAREIRKLARRLISRKAISKPGDYPGRNTGDLRRSISVIGLKKSMGALILPKQTPLMKARGFFPEMLSKGTKRRIQKLEANKGVGRSNRRRRGQRVADSAARAGSGDYMIEPRANYMETALNARRTAARDAISQVLKTSLTPR